jgi:hypothetical protein
MKTLIESTDTSAAYEFSHLTATRVVKFEKPKDSEITPDFEAISEEEYLKWLAWLGE